MADKHAGLLSDLLTFVKDEQAAGNGKLLDVWNRPIAQKLQTGWSQAFDRLERADELDAVWAFPLDADSRFREGDLLALHGGSPIDDLLARELTFESEEDGRWLLRGKRAPGLLQAYKGGPLFADPDAIDLTQYFERVIQEIGASQIGREIVLPLLAGDLEITFTPADYDFGLRAAEARGFNAKQADAVALAFGANQIACIQGPPGTGKSSVLALIARLMVDRGERVLVTSHTHMAINNALNKIHREKAPVAKIGRPTQRKGLDNAIACLPNFADWADRPAGGYVIGATPFATCSPRLSSCEFDAIIFDEASQVTVPLALMAMRKGQRFVFIGDQRQLPPVMLSRSVLDKNSMSVFAALTSKHAEHSVMLEQTYRMNRWLTAWPSQTYYAGELQAAGNNVDRRLCLTQVPLHLADVFDAQDCGVFIPTRDRSARTQNFRDAELVADLCAAAVDGGLAPEEIGIVTPYRAQGRAVRNLLLRRLGRRAAHHVVADTVERMQGQERELIILSLATGDEVFLQAVAEFFFQPQRLNVSITRPKTKLIVIGPELSSVPDVEHSEVRHWIANYIEFLRTLRRIVI